jgi:hypothetical protein
LRHHLRNSRTHCTGAENCNFVRFIVHIQNCGPRFRPLICSRFIYL